MFLSQREHTRKDQVLVVAAGGGGCMATPGGSWSWSCSKSCGLQLSLVLLCLLSFTFLSSKSVSVKVDNYQNYSKDMTMNSRFVLGSRPPRCINRCMSCRPCRAVLVIPPNRKHRSNDVIKSSSITPQDHDEGYYLLSWKCTCKTKLFQP